MSLKAYFRTQGSTIEVNYSRELENGMMISYKTNLVPRALFPSGVGD